MEKNKLYQEVWRVQSQRNQLIKTMEECGELIQAISKLLLNETDLNIINFNEEVADVYIMIDQIKSLMNQTDIDYMINYKLKRLQRNLKFKQL